MRRSSLVLRRRVTNRAASSRFTPSIPAGSATQPRTQADTHGEALFALHRSGLTAIRAFRRSSSLSPEAPRHAAAVLPCSRSFKGKSGQTDVDFAPMPTTRCCTTTVCMSKVSKRPMSSWLVSPARPSRGQLATQALRQIADAPVPSAHSGAHAQSEGSVEDFECFLTASFLSDR
jgi:hypothetical protein